MDDGWMDVCLIQAMTTLDFMALLTRVSTGEHVDDERVMYFRARELALTFDRAVAVNTDGQVLEATECRYTVLPRAARFLVPNGGLGSVAQPG
jgi:diacylglycerol kinase (ATP)